MPKVLVDIDSDESYRPSYGVAWEHSRRMMEVPVNLVRRVALARRLYNALLDEVEEYVKSHPEDVRFGPAYDSEGNYLGDE